MADRDAPELLDDLRNVAKSYSKQGRGRDARELEDIAEALQSRVAELDAITQAHTGYAVKPFYSAVCRCGVVWAENPSDWYDDTVVAAFVAEESGWVQQPNGTWLCDDCECEAANAEEDGRSLWPNGATDRDGDWLEDEL